MAEHLSSNRKQESRKNVFDLTLAILALVVMFGVYKVRAKK